MEALKAELEHYKTDKEKIRDLVGCIGGRANRRQRAVTNAIFLLLVISAFGFELLRLCLGWEMSYLPSVLVVEVAVLLVSLKIIWMIHMQSKVDHFQFWILHSIEFQMSMLSRRINKMSEAIDANGMAPRKEPGEERPSFGKS